MNPSSIWPLKGECDHLRIEGASTGTTSKFDINKDEALATWLALVQQGLALTEPLVLELAFDVEAEAPPA